jgi:hypothetical protein
MSSTPQYTSVSLLTFPNSFICPIPNFVSFIRFVSDLSRNPMIVPLRILRGHGVVGGIGVHAIAFHPRQPWIFSAGADGLINLYQDI